jgi:hypothetical protein
MLVLVVYWMMLRPAFIPPWKVHHPNAHTTQSLNLNFEDHNATTLENNTIFTITRIFFIKNEIFRDFEKSIKFWWGKHGRLGNVGV